MGRLIVIAHENEIPNLKPEQNRWNNNYLLYSGVGILEAMYSFQKRLNQGPPPNEVILAGSAGCQFTQDVLRIFLCNQFELPRYKTEQIPELVTTRFSTESKLAFKNTIVYSTIGISTIHEPVDNFKRANNSGSIYLENMEAVGIAYVCHREKIPFTALIVTTNTIGPDSRTQWRQNVREAGETLYKELLSLQ